jgi:dipeptidyl aminopeptidase/acylaminoacyl peptidase
VIAGADHRLTDPDHRREALERSREWLHHHLASQRTSP